MTEESTRTGESGYPPAQRTEDNCSVAFHTPGTAQKESAKPDSRDTSIGASSSGRAVLAGRLWRWTKEAVELVASTLVLLIAIRWLLVEPRYIPSSSMEPTLQVDDRILVEKLSGHLGSPIQRGDIIVFYPGEKVTGKQPGNGIQALFGRLTGLPFFPNDPAYIKRVVGLQGEHIVIEKGVGVFIDGQLLDEAYVSEKPQYSLRSLKDIGGQTAAGFVRPYGESTDPIIVPAGHVFVLGDNRNCSTDSHVWGFLDQKRAVGRAWGLFFRELKPPPTAPSEINL